MTDRPTSWSMDGTGGLTGFPPGGSPPPPPLPAGPQRDGPAWERRQGIMDLGAMLVTVKDVLVEAPATFAGMIRDGGLGSPLVFMLILSTIFGWLGMAWVFLWDQALGATLLGSGPVDYNELGFELDPALMAFMGSGLFQIVQALILPAIVLVVFFIEAAVFHLFLLIMGGANQPFETTARVVAYTTGAAAVFQAVPMCGGLIAFVWALIVIIIGLAHAHETSVGRAVAAVLLPVLLCCLCCVLVAILAGMSLAQVAGGNL
jgi:hypothetical protein